MRALPASLLALLWLVHPAAAATFAVDSTVDAVDANPGDGRCAASAGDCTLRAAVMEANAWPGFDRIELQSVDYPLTLTGELAASSGFVEEQDASVGDLDLLEDVWLGGPTPPERFSPGAGPAAARILTAVEGSASARAFEVAAGVSAELHDLVIQPPPDRFQLGPTPGGGVLNLGDLVLDHASLEGIVIFGGLGAGVFNAGRLRIVACAFRDNRAQIGRASAVGNAADLWIADTVMEQSVSEGGAIWAAAAGATQISDSSVLDNVGGGILNFGSMTLDRTTVARNVASNASAGGIFNMGDLSMTHSTVSGNSSAGVLRGLIGGIDNRGELVIADSTITENLGPELGRAGIAGSATVSGSINAGNEGEIRDDCAGTFLSLGNNLVGSGCPDAGFDHPTDRVVLGPQLGTLADNGGPTATHAPLPGSHAIDADPDCPAGKDQRGVPRPLDGDGDGIAACDIGAVEFGTLVELDIEPDSDRNEIRLNGHQVIPVALLATERFDPASVDPDTLAFGPRGAMALRLLCKDEGKGKGKGWKKPRRRKRFHDDDDGRRRWRNFADDDDDGGGNRGRRRWAPHEDDDCVPTPFLADVNDDLVPDLVSHYRRLETGIVFGDAEACLVGKTRDGTPLAGCDSVETAFACGMGYEVVFVLPPLLWLRRRRRAMRA